jgi:hypothetical protein
MLHDRSFFFHPDFTVGSGFTPDLLTFFVEKALAGFYIA